MPRTKGTFFVPQMIIAALILFMTAINIALPQARGIPDYKSLEVVSGILESKKPCTTGRKSPTLLPVVISTSTGKRELMIPCSEAIQALQLGVAVEIRARNAISLFASEQRFEVWSVTAQGAELYRYAERVDIEKKLMLADAFMLCILGLAAYLGFRRFSEDNSNVS